MLKACADRALACLCTLVAVVVVMASSLPINAAQAVAGALGRVRWSRALASHWWSLLQFMAEVWSDVRISFTGDSIAGSNECAICISNHSPGIDMLPGICLAGRAVGAGSVIATIKQSLRYVPGIGWTNYLQGSLFLKRSWTQDRPALGRRLDSVPRPFWLGIFPEGTRITPAKRAESQAFAEARGLPRLANVLVPRTKGFTFTVQRLRASLDAVYDITAAYEGSPFYLSDVLLRGRFRTRALHFHVRRVPTSQLPSSDADLEQWLYDAFAQKDALLAHFRMHGYYPGAAVDCPAPALHLLIRFNAWVLAFAVGLLALGGWSPASIVWAALSVATIALACRRTYAHVNRRSVLEEQHGDRALAEAIPASGRADPTKKHV
ncbi:unnamed protein product (mitochondrion) [Plasmodiophora brassicae]|uniref:Phospholipid/glycerol acyltransferase domain-containing protein n=1 Tax=Plasmodiophora brassicae TaxID=37360 RepID=A0A0G4J035_PLABS|nr:hypothetical protein PBRA_008305 [Plasmodiophora brassicae]SPQ95295.1 unnamed protein product [Plasmodiophora brassicae]